MKEEEIIVSLLSEPLKKLGYDLVEVRLKGGKEKTLSIVVDRVEPISLDDIVTVSEAVSALLDEADPIESAYTLDISSLGAEKPIALEKLGEYVGRYVNLHLSNPYQGENILEGTIESIDEEILVLKLVIKGKAKNVELKRSNIDKARLAIQF